MPIEVIDTGGLDDRGSVSIHIQKQVKLAINDSDAILFLVDSQTGITALDHHFAQWIRKSVQQSIEMKKSTNNGISTSSHSLNSKAEVIVVVNKAEGAHMSDQVMNTVAEACRLGFSDPIVLSASHGY